MLHGFIACLQMLRSYYLWLAGEKDAAFDALQKALAAAKALDRTKETVYASPLLRQIKPTGFTNPGTFAAELPELWPWWSVPERKRIKAEMQSDPRWAAWENAAKGK